MSAAPGRARIETRFHHATIRLAGALPAAIPADSVHRVHLANIFTLYDVATSPLTCRAIVRYAAQIVSKSPAGQAIVVGSRTPEMFPEAAAVELMQRGGFALTARESSRYYTASGENFPFASTAGWYALRFTYSETTADSVQ